MKVILRFITPLLWNSMKTLNKSSNHIPTLLKHVQGETIWSWCLFLSNWKIALQTSSSIKGRSNQLVLSTAMGDQSNPSKLKESLEGLEYDLESYIILLNCFQQYEWMKHVLLACLCCPDILKVGIYFLWLTTGSVISLYQKHNRSGNWLIIFYMYFLIYNANALFFMD